MGWETGTCRSRFSRRGRASAPQTARLRLSVGGLDDLPEIILAHVDDGKLALGIFHGIARMRGIDRDIRAEFTADGTGWGFGGIGGAEHVTDFPDGIDPLVQ